MVKVKNYNLIKETTCKSKQCYSGFKFSLKHVDVAYVKYLHVSSINRRHLTDKQTAIDDNNRTEELEILWGVRQWCILSPLPFNLHCVGAGILLNGLKHNHLRRSDNTIVFADTIKELQYVLDINSSESKK